MKYDFDKNLDRDGLFSYKWSKKDVLPMWVADMDFESPKPLLNALHQRIDRQCFGYTYTPDELYEAYRSFWLRRHHVEFKKEWMIYSTGVIPSISSAVRRLTEVANNVVIMTPVYNIFFNSIVNNGRKVLESPLRYENHQYSIDFEDLEKKLSLEETSLLILCNPHNPVGKIYTKEELDRIGKLCDKYGVKVISDEIHCDIVRPGKEYIPFASVSEINRNISVTCIAPTKCFSVPGIQSSIMVVANPYLKHLVERGLNTDECAEGNIFGLMLPQILFNECEDWLDQMNEYVQKNKEYVTEYLNKHHPEIYVIKQDATYLMWLDVSEIEKDGTKLKEYLLEEHHLWLSEGAVYGETGRSFLRMNVATSLSRIKEGLRRFTEGINKYKEEHHD